MERKVFDNNALLQHCLEFSLAIIEFTEHLESLRKFVIANQLLKAGSSIGANVMEAQSAESRADFYHKLKIADKEACETKYWLYLCEHAPSYPFDVRLSQKLREIMVLLNAILSRRPPRQP